LQQFLKSL